MSKPSGGSARGDPQTWLEQGDCGSESSCSEWSSSEDTLSISQGPDDLHLEERTGTQPLDTALVDMDAENPAIIAPLETLRSATRSISREHADDRMRGRRGKAPWSCYRAMGQGGRALALAGVTLAAMLGIMKINGAGFQRASLDAVQTKPVNYNSLLGQLRWWCYHGYKWRHVSHDFEMAGLLACHQLLSLADLTASPATGPSIPAPAPVTPEAPAPAPGPAGSEPYPCANDYESKGAGTCYGTRDTSGLGLLQNATSPQDHWQCAALCEEHSEYFSVVGGTHVCSGYNFYPQNGTCILYTSTRPDHVIGHEDVTTCCASLTHGPPPGPNFGFLSGVFR